MPLIFLAIVVAILVIFLLNSKRWSKVSRSAREGKRGFRDEIGRDDD
ncbi:MAG: hypothetical protein R3C15_22755 [Thermoleophilia bacterium]